MASNINTTDIDAEFPVAGQDNDSQGFRDNFATIKDNFSAAKSEIEALQSGTAKIAEDNDFNGNKIQEANFLATTELVLPKGQVNNSGGAGANISFVEGSYQTMTVTEDITARFVDWPATLKFGKIRVVVTANSLEHTVTWSTEAGGTIKYDSNFPSPFTVDSATTAKIVDAWTDDGGVTVYMQYIGEFSA